VSSRTARAIQINPVSKKKEGKKERKKGKKERRKEGRKEGKKERRKEGKEERLTRMLNVPKSCDERYYMALRER
jgi:flagellar biosynthesis/type III secretory pathway protein FliH